MKKSIAILAASGLIALGGAAAVSAAPADDTTTAPSAVVLTADESARPNPLTDVLEDLVTDGTITQAQADKIASALEARRTEMRATREAAREQMRSFLEDGVISADELAQLPADHPLKGLDSILDDGQITLDELRSLRSPGGFGHRDHGGPLGSGGFGNGGGTEGSSS